APRSSERPGARAPPATTRATRRTTNRPPRTERVRLGNRAVARTASAQWLRLDEEQRLAILNRLAVLDEDADDAPGDLALDLVHQLHRPDDADDLSFLHDVALAHV